MDAVNTWGFVRFEFPNCVFDLAPHEDASGFKKFGVGHS